MRGLGLAATILLLTASLAGCISPETVDKAGATNTPLLSVEDVQVPDGAEAVPIEGGVRLVFEDVDLPLREEFTIPEGVTMVRATAEVPQGTDVLTYMRHAGSKNGRCEYQILRSWNQDVEGTASCTGLTALDPLPTTWETYIVADAERADLVQVDLLTRPLDGPASKLNLSQLSMPQHEALPTTVETVESHDGTPLHVEVTRPDVEGSVPTILISSPYTHFDRQAGERPYDEFIRDWVPRGYAVVVADVRGFGESGGCVEVWGPNEKKDQKVLVDWIAEQGWSDGHVGMVGVSYVGTTPVEAAVQAPDNLDAIASIAAVVSAYDDWHFGGVPNGESALSPAAYQAIGSLARVQAEDPLTTAVNHGNGLCDPTLAARANDPRAVYDGFYEVRDFKLGVGDVEAAVLYQHGFEDPNVKSAMVPGWFNDITAPKLGLFGHWSHQYAVRGDQDTLLLAWMDAHVKGRDLGFGDVAPVHVQTDEGMYRTGDTWPPQDATDATLYPAFGEMSIGTTASDGSATLRMDPTGLSDDLAGDQGTVLRLQGQAPADIPLAGSAGLELAVTLESSENAHVAAFLYERGDGDQDGWKLVTWGMANLAHRNGHTEYEPATPGERIQMRLPFLPTEATIQEGHDVLLTIRAAEPNDWALVQPGEPGELTLHGGADGTRLVLPTVSGQAYRPVPSTVAP